MEGLEDCFCLVALEKQPWVYTEFPRKARSQKPPLELASDKGLGERMKNVSKVVTLATLIAICLAGSLAAEKKHGYAETDLVVNQIVKGVPTLSSRGPARQVGDSHRHRLQHCPGRGRVQDLGLHRCWNADDSTSDFPVRDGRWNDRGLESRCQSRRL